MAAYEVLLLNTAIPQIQAAQSGDTYVVPRDIAINATAIISANSATDALRITQTGAGNAILVEDSANPDSTPFVVTAAGDVGIGLTNPGQKLHIDRSFDGSTWSKISNGNNTAGAAAGILFGNNNGDTGAISILSTANSPADALFLRTLSTNPLVFGTGNAEKMRLNSSGNLGIGETNPVAKLDVADSSGGAPSFRITNSATSAWMRLVNTGGGNAFVDSNVGFAFRVGGSYTTAATIDSSGNLGLGVTPSLWGAAIKAQQIGSAYSLGFSAEGDDSSITTNAYKNTSGIWVLQTSSSYKPTRYNQYLGKHIWSYGASGSANDAASFTEAMTLDASGNLVVGDTSTSFRLASLVASGANRDVFQAGISGASNGLTVKWNHATTTLRVNLTSLPTSSAGLAAGDLWNDSGTLKIA